MELSGILTFVKLYIDTIRIFIYSPLKQKTKPVVTAVAVRREELGRRMGRRVDSYRMLAAIRVCRWLAFHCWVFFTPSCGIVEPSVLITNRHLSPTLAGRDTSEGSLLLQDETKTKKTTSKGRKEHVPSSWYSVIF